MTTYDYRLNMYDDIKQALEDRNTWDDLTQYNDFDDLREELYNDLWTDDSVTGNGSGSYTFNRAEALEYIEAGNLSLAVEACREFCADFGTYAEDEDWEALDVTIRCYLLGEVLDEVLEDMGGEVAFIEAQEAADALDREEIRETAKAITAEGTAQA